MALYLILQLDELSVLQYNKNVHYGRNTKEGKGGNRTY